MRIILFLCTGNYCRSRYAELYFNHRARQAALPWLALSRGLALEFGIKNAGPISPYVRDEMARLNIDMPDDMRFPRAVTNDDLLIADRVVALNDSEHRPLMRERLSCWQTRVEYWSIGDVGDAYPDKALPLLADKVDGLIGELGSVHIGIGTPPPACEDCRRMFCPNAGRGRRFQANVQ